MTLSNGLQIIHQSPVVETHMVCIRAYCKVGSIYEVDAHMRGASHFVEHMCFKGTRSLPGSKEVFGSHDKIGAHLNAYTEKNHTCYTVDCHQDFTKHCLSILSDMMLNSTFPEQEYDKEYNVVLEENTKNMTNYAAVSYEQLEYMVYQGTRYALPVDDACYHTPGHPIPRNELIEFYNTYYVPSNMIVSVVSMIPFTTVVKYMKESYFGRKQKLRETVVPANPYRMATPGKCLTFYKQDNANSIYVREEKNLDTTYLNIGFYTCNHYSNDKHVLDMACRLLDGGASSRLFTLLREKHGLTYSSSAYSSNNEIGGLFGISALTDTHFLKSNSSRKPGVFDLIMKLVDDLSTRGFTKAEYDDMIVGFRNQIRQIESTSVFANYNGICMLEQTEPPMVSYQELCKKLLNIRLDDINACIRKYITRENIYVSIVGGGKHFPTKKMVEKWIRK